VTRFGRTLAFIGHELREMLPPTLFFAVGFTLIELTTQLILSDYLVRVANFVLLMGGALVVGKAVLLANLLPFIGRFDAGPMYRPVLFKACVYGLTVMVARLLEGVIEFLIDGGRIADFGLYLVSHYTWHRVLATQIWIFVLFLIYLSVVELDVRLGKGKLFRMAFTQARTGGTA
jgi:hypothetical protein